MSLNLTKHNNFFFHRCPYSKTWNWMKSLYLQKTQYLQTMMFSSMFYLGKEIVIYKFVNWQSWLLNSGRKQIAVLILFSELPSCLNKFTITIWNISRGVEIKTITNVSQHLRHHNQHKKVVGTLLFLLEVPLLIKFYQFWPVHPPQSQLSQTQTTNL